MTGTPDTKKYLEYLDKEMSIMGILSAVSVIAPGGILSAVLASDKGAATVLWTTGSFFIITGAAMCVVAGLYFYRQRSSLAWFYGQICLTEALNGDVSKIRELLREADSWETWWSYSWGFTFLITGFIEYLLAAFLYLVPPRWTWCNAHLHIIKIVAFVLCPLIAVSIAVLQKYVLTRYKFSDDYWTDFWGDIWKRHATVPPPHRGVYTRLKPSSIHGLGVFALLDIPNGTYIFEPDDEPTVKVAAQEIKPLPKNLRQLYEDFCVLKDGEYECPVSFNELTPSWYLNHSSSPNVAADSTLKFYAIQDIKAGEELTADYESYSENKSDSAPTLYRRRPDTATEESR